MSLKPTWGTCKAEGCKTPGDRVLVISGRCRPCANKRFRGYGKAKPLGNGPIKRKTPIKKARKPTGELKFFQELWEDEKNRPHVSFLSGQAIKYFNPWCFAHVLAKGPGAYPRYRLEPKNIVYLTPDEHHQQHSIAQSDLIKKDPRWQKFFDLQEELRIKYNNE